MSDDGFFPAMSDCTNCYGSCIYASEPDMCSQYTNEEEGTDDDR